uniref:Ubiquitin-like protease family profile domain-containing protein n=1 Tax=Daucus carota subsp. sativus TaxID=79200 RepID=A0A166G2Y5_DAUCS
MDDMLIQFNRTRLDIVEMVFFPICAFEHFYLISYNIKNAAYEIIDNIDREIDAQICYGDKPRILTTWNLRVSLI